MRDDAVTVGEYAQRPTGHAEHGFCGCCGNPIQRTDNLWCHRCRGHVGSVGSVEERTWFAMTGEVCPHQIGEVVV